MTRLVRLIKIRHLYLAIRNFVEYEHITRLLAPLRRPRSGFALTTPPTFRSLTPSAPQALLGYDDAEPRSRTPHGQDSFLHFLASRPRRL